MIAPYSTPARGFMTLEPIRDLGEDEVVALWRAGVRKGNLSIAKGRALLILGGGAPVALRIDAMDEQEARRMAVRLLPDGDVVLLAAVCRGRSTVFRRVEILSAMTPSEAARRPEVVHIVAPSGEIVEKSMSPADPRDAKTIADRLASQLRYAEFKKYGAEFKKYVETLNVDWRNLTPSSFSSKVAEMRTDLRRMLGAQANNLMPTWRTKVETTLTNVFKTTRQVIRDNFAPTVGLSLRQPDIRAVGNISAQQGLFMRNASGFRSDQLTRQAKNIVTDGLRNGFGKNEIAKQLRDQLPNAWQAKGLQYFKTVASAGVSRARSYSEVSGYLEVGIEALEVQAIMDERTTEICRCLDGMVVDTHVASVQVMGAINSVDPEASSPFLREVRDKATGVNQILAGNGVKIADVIRSGVGRADDRGQFSYNKALAGISEQNIGPPPYHHLCRSWTVPVAGTVSVPRGTWPRATGPVSPTPPRPVPKGSAPARGVGPRPQKVYPEPKPGIPTMVGERDVVDRYSFSDDFLSPDDVRLFGEDGAAIQRYQFHAHDMAIRPVGGLERIPRPSSDVLPGEWNALENLANAMGLTAETSGVVVHVEQLNLANMRQVVLAEAKQPAATRVYSIRSSDGSQRFIRFNPDKRAAAKDGLAALRRADTEFKISDTLGTLSDKGYITIADDAKALTFGKPVPAMKPIPAPPPVKRPLPPKPKPKPRPITEPGPPQRRKPPATVEPKMPYDKPPPAPAPKKPRVAAPATREPPQPKGPAKDYSEYGLLDGVPVTEQVRERIAYESARLQDVLKAAEQRYKTLGVRLSARARGDLIRDFVAKDTGQVQKITSRMVSSATKKIGQAERRSLKNSVHSKMQSGSLTRIDKAKPVGVRPVPSDKLTDLYNDAFQHLSQRVLDKALERGLPRVFYGTNVSDGAFYSEALDAIVIPEKVGWGGFCGRSSHQLFRHEFGHYTDRLGAGKDAALAFRDTYKLGPEKFKAADGKWEYVKGKWGDWYCGRIYEHSATEVTSVISESFAAEARNKLSEMYMANPDHVGYAMAHAKGAFIP